MKFRMLSSPEGKGLRFGGDLLILDSRILFQLFTQIFPKNKNKLNKKHKNCKNNTISEP